MVNTQKHSEEAMQCMMPNLANTFLRLMMSCGEERKEVQHHQYNKTDHNWKNNNLNKRVYSKSLVSNTIPKCTVNELQPRTHVGVLEDEE